MYQNSSDTVAYVLTANTSHISGLRHCGQRPIVFGYGSSQYASHGRPTCSSGYMPAHATANRVIASANRLMLVRHCWRTSSRMAEISVPAWPMPIHQTKLMMSNAHPTGTLLPHAPMPLSSRTLTAYMSDIVPISPTPIMTIQRVGTLVVRMIRLMLSPTDA
jgi:hypothetical protein